MVREKKERERERTEFENYRIITQNVRKKE